MAIIEVFGMTGAGKSTVVSQAVESTSATTVTGWDRRSVARFVLRNPSWAKVSYSLIRRTTLGDKKTLAKESLVAGSQLELAMRRSREGYIVIVEEGPLQRYVALAARAPDRPSIEIASRYVASMPQADGYLWLETSVETSLQRVNARPRHQGLRASSDFIAKSKAHARTLVEALGGTTAVLASQNELLKFIRLLQLRGGH